MTGGGFRQGAEGRLAVSRQGEVELRRDITPRLGTTFRKSSYSGTDNPNCAEAALRDGAVLVRDSKDRDGPVLKFSGEEWERFIAGVKAA